MTTRTTKTSVTFRSSTALRGIDAPLSAGPYEIDYVDTVAGGETASPASVATLIYLRTGSLTRVISIDRADLEAAIGRDKQPGERV